MKNNFLFFALLGLVLLAPACGDDEMPPPEEMVDENFVWRTEYVNGDWGAVSMKPVLYNDYVIFSQYNGTSESFEKDTGKEVWTWDEPEDLSLQGAAIENYAVHDNILYVLVQQVGDFIILGINLNDGTETWRSDLSLNYNSRFYIHDGKMYIENAGQVSNSSYLYVGDIGGDNFELLTFPDNRDYQRVFGLHFEVDESTGNEIMYFFADNDDFDDIIVRWDRTDDTFVVNEDGVSAINYAGNSILTEDKLLVGHASSNIAFMDKNTLEFLNTDQILFFDASNTKILLDGDQFYTFASFSDKVTRGTLNDEYVYHEKSYDVEGCNDMLVQGDQLYLLDLDDEHTIRIYDKETGTLNKSIKSPYVQLIASRSF